MWPPIVSQKDVLKMSDGRAHEEKDVVTSAGLTLDHEPEFWSSLMSGNED